MRGGGRRKEENGETYRFQFVKFVCLTASVFKLKAVVQLCYLDRTQRPCNHNDRQKQQRGPILSYGISREPRTKIELGLNVPRVTSLITKASGTYPILLSFSELGLLYAKTIALTTPNLIGKLWFSLEGQNWVGSIWLGVGTLILVA